MKRSIQFVVFALLFWAFSASAAVKYVFLFVGDGCGVNQLKLARDEYGTPAMDQLPVKTRMGTLNVNGKVTDSAASGTAIACGFKTYNSSIGMTPERKPALSISKKLKARGFKIGIISTSPIDDATPAAHYANQVSRKMYAEIVGDLARGDFDFYGASHFYLSKGKTEADFLALIGKNYTVTRGTDWSKLDPNGKNFVISRLVRDWGDAPRRTPSIVDMTKLAVKTVDNPNGFFLMIEEGFTDNYSHQNDAGGLIRAVRDLDNAVAVALEFQKRHPQETLIVVTADHTTGEIIFGENYRPGKTNLKVQRNEQSALDQLVKKRYAARVSREKIIAELCEKLDLHDLTAAERKKLDEAFDYFVLKMRKKGKQEDGYTISMKPSVDGMKLYSPLVITAMRIRDARCGISWVSFSHTDTPVLTQVKGPGAEKFTGKLENCDLSHKIAEIVTGKDIMAEIPQK